MNDWKHSLDKAIEGRDWNEVVLLLEKEKTKHAGTAPAQVKRKVIKAILKKFKDDPQVLFQTSEHFLKSESPSAKEVCAHLIPEIYVEYPTEGERLLHKIADDDNWEVREWAAGGCGEILANWFDDFYLVIDRWKEDDSENIRRAAVLAVMYASKSLDESRAEQLLKILEPLMKDKSEYVKKNLGAFAIGDALLIRYPRQVTPWLESLIRSNDVNVRWNIAMVFTAAAARAFQKEGEELLKKLEGDERKTVERAVQKAKRNLAKAPREHVT